MILIDKVTAANGEQVTRERRACRRCHRVNAVFHGTRKTCEECRSKSTIITEREHCFDGMRLSREAQRRSDEVFRYAMSLRAAYDADIHRNVG